MSEETVDTCCCWIIEGGLTTVGEMKSYVCIRFQKYIPDGGEVLISVTIEFGGVTWVFVHNEDTGINLTKNLQGWSSASKNAYFDVIQSHWDRREGERPELGRIASIRVRLMIGHIGGNPTWSTTNAKYGNFLCVFSNSWPPGYVYLKHDSSRFLQYEKSTLDPENFHLRSRISSGFVTRFFLWGKPKIPSLTRSSLHKISVTWEMHGGPNPVGFWLMGLLILGEIYFCTVSLRVLYKLCSAELQLALPGNYWTEFSLVMVL